MTEAVTLKLEKKQEGVKPALQGRSKHRRDELIHAGMKLLCEKSMNDISIIELTAACGYSVGTFYSRFEDKQSFFRAIQETAITHRLELFEAEFSDPKWKTASPEEIFAHLVNNTVDFIDGSWRGVVKESILGSCTNTEIWEPLRLGGRKISNVIVDLLEPHFLDDNPEESRDSVKFGMQMFFGTIVQAALNNPGPVRLEDKQFRENLTRMLTLYSKLK
ncbi:MAG: TetR/AcrR family transcriptional regulator [Sneathiellales bacterium]|nr:TetR/AcrR family transcriptional regulator [Sneathiellales bacterium]